MAESAATISKVLVRTCMSVWILSAGSPIEDAIDIQCLRLTDSVITGSCSACSGSGQEDCRIATCAPGYSTFQGTAGTACGRGTSSTVCEPINRNDYSSWEAMQAAGWTHSDLIVGMDSSELSSVCQTGPNFFGWALDSAIGELRITLPAAGTVTVDFGNCWMAGLVILSLNGEPIASAPQSMHSVVHVQVVEKGDVLALRDEGSNSVIRLNSVRLDCDDIRVSSLTDDDRFGVFHEPQLYIPFATTHGGLVGQATLSTSASVGVNGLALDGVDAAATIPNRDYAAGGAWTVALWFYKSECASSSDEGEYLYSHAK